MHFCFGYDYKIYYTEKLIDRLQSQCVPTYVIKTPSLVLNKNFSEPSSCCSVVAASGCYRIGAIVVIESLGIILRIEYRRYIYTLYNA